MKEDDPLIPGKVESLSQLLLIVDHPETPLGVGMKESGRIGDAFHRRRPWHWLSGGQIQQPLNRLIWQVSDQRIEVVFGNLTHRVQPFRGYAEGQQIVALKLAEQRRIHLLLNDLRYFPDRFANLDD